MIGELNKMLFLMGDHIIKISENNLIEENSISSSEIKTKILSHSL